MIWLFAIISLILTIIVLLATSEMATWVRQCQNQARRRIHAEPWADPRSWQRLDDQERRKSMTRYR